MTNELLLIASAVTNSTEADQFHIWQEQQPEGRCTNTMQWGSIPCQSIWRFCSVRHETCTHGTGTNAESGPAVTMLDLEQTGTRCPAPHLAENIEDRDQSIWVMVEQHHLSAFFVGESVIQGEVRCEPKCPTIRKDFSL